MIKNIFNFHEFNRINEKLIDKVLYHGSPNIFKEFKNTTAFFSETKDFAVSYSNQKSFDQALDSEANSYTVRVRCDLFNINDKSDEAKIRKLLPEKVKYMYNNFGFDAEEEKDEFILNMKGFYTNTPYKDAVEKSVGDEFPDPRYAGDTFVIFKKDNEYTYTYDKKTYRREFNKIGNYYLRNGIFKDIKEFVSNYIKEKTDRKYITEDNFKAYMNVFQLQGEKNWFGIDDIDEENQRKFDEMYSELEEKVVQTLVDKKYFKKFNLQVKTEELIDTWRYYENETVYDAIVKLGYGGYVARENKVPTYAIFNPKESVTIIKYEIPDGIEYNSWDERLDFLQYDKKIAHLIKELPKDDQKNFWMYLNRWETYKFWKENKPVESLMKHIKSRFK